jgi:hypothetical protein
MVTPFLILDVLYRSQTLRHASALFPVSDCKLKSQTPKRGFI